MRAQLHLLWEVPLQALGLRQSGVRLPLTVAICCVPQLEAICGQGKLWIKLSVTPRWWERPGRARVSVSRVVGCFKFALMSLLLHLLGPRFYLSQLSYKDGESEDPFLFHFETESNVA